MNKDEKDCRELLSRNIKHFRSRLGFSQLDLALELDMSTTFLSNIEIGKKWVSAKTLAQIAKALKIEVYELFKPEKESQDALSAEVIRYLDTVDDTLAKHIAHAIEPAINRTVLRAIAKMRRHYDTGNGV
jgi:transcriptional regulator with XRE-family HTH domain